MVCPSADNVGLLSSNSELTGALIFCAAVHGASSDGRLDCHSSMCKPSDRFEPNTSTRPSKESAGCRSSRLLFTVGPRFSGAFHGAAVVGRRHHQRSFSPKPGPGRPFAWKKSESPSDDCSGPPCSLRQRRTMGPVSWRATKDRLSWCGYSSRDETRAGASPRSLAKISVKPSADNDGFLSEAFELTFGPRFSGTDQGVVSVGRRHIHRSTNA